MKAQFYKLRIRFKYMALGFSLPVESFCKHCGCKVRDFNVNDEIWARVEIAIPKGNTLCFECFCKAAKEVGIEGIPTVTFPEATGSS